MNGLEWLVAAPWLTVRQPDSVLVVGIVDRRRDEQHLRRILEPAAVGVFAGTTQTSPFLTGQVTPPTVTEPVPSST